jgi:hypothetical protein
MRHATSELSGDVYRRQVTRARVSLGADLDLEGVRGAVVAGAAAIAVAFAVTYHGRLLGLLVTAIVVVIVVSLKPDVFLAGALVVVGLASVLEKYALHFGPATVYPTDIVVGLAIIRSLRPADRFPSKRALGPALLLAAGIWGALMLIAGIRARDAGESLDTIIRYETALLYFPALYFSLSRLLREKALNLPRLWLLLAVASVGFVVWMFVMRVLNMPFENVSNGGSRLGEVATSSGSTVRRDFGSATAFVIYPTLAVAGVAAMAYSSRKGASAALAGVGIIATFVTLIRSEIFGMLLGIAVILVLRQRGQRTSRLFTAAALAGGSVAALLALAYINPSVRDAIVQRTLPWVSTESKTANETAEYRMKALRLGASVANAHPGGIGFRNQQVLAQSKIDPEYLGHSAPAWLLVFTGWLGLTAAAAVLAGLLVRSFRVPSSLPWLHPAFVGIIVMLVVYSFGADGIVGQSWVIVLTAMAIALRFSLIRRET